MIVHSKVYYSRNNNVWYIFVNWILINVMILCQKIIISLKILPHLIIINVRIHLLVLCRVLVLILGRFLACLLSLIWLIIMVGSWHLGFLGGFVCLGLSWLSWIRIFILSLLDCFLVGLAVVQPAISTFSSSARPSTTPKDKNIPLLYRSSLPWEHSWGQPSSTSSMTGGSYGVSWLSSSQRSNSCYSSATWKKHLISC